MEHTQYWSYSPSESIYNPDVSSNVSSYVVRPNKISKSSIRNSSPRMNGRRRTATLTPPASSRTRSVVDNLRSSVQPRRDSDSSRSRPVSWHPNSIGASSGASNLSTNGQELCPWNFSTTQVNGLVTPISYPALNVPQIQDLFTPLEDLPGQEYPLNYPNHSYDEQTWLAHGDSRSDPYSYPMFLQQSSAPPSWQLNQQAPVPSVQTAPPSPDSFPVQTAALDKLSLGCDASDSKHDSEELVGMGLYDSPAEVQSSALLSGSLSSLGRKGLKLEESFVPEENEDEDADADAEAEEEDEEDDDDAEDSLDPSTASQMDHNYEYGSQSIANHLTWGMQPQTDSIASKYLATLRQLNSAYYPAGHSAYGWI